VNRRPLPGYDGADSATRQDKISAAL